MKKILVIIPSFEAGGTNSSLLSLIHAFSEENITIFPMSNGGEFRHNFTGVPHLTREFLMNLWVGDFAEFDCMHKLMALVIKPIKRIAARLGFNIEKWILKQTARKKKFSGFELVIGYQEGIATEFATLIPANEHIAWVHCNLLHCDIDFRRYADTYKACDNVICVSKNSKEAFDSIYPYMASKSEVIYNLIDNHKIIQLSAAYDSALDKIPEKDTVILSVGRLHPIKQFEKIPQIAAELKKFIPNFKWIIIGGNNISIKKQIEDNIEHYDVADNVLLVGFKSNPYPFFRHADLYVCTSQSEACPMVFLEANTLGIYVVSNDFPSAHEIIDSNGTICRLDNMAATIANYINTNPKPNVNLPESISQSYSALNTLFNKKSYVPKTIRP